LRDSLLGKIVDYMSTQKEVELKELYEHFGDEKHTTIRGRINEAVGSKLIRTGKGKYILAGAEIEAIVEKADAKSAAPEILRAQIYYDLIFLDPPYRTGGQKGGNRDLSDYQMIEPEEFAEIVSQAQKMLRGEDSQLYFMIAGGTSSKPMADKYIRAFGNTSLKKAGQGSYLKLNQNGTVCNMGKYLMPAEEIHVFSHSGKLAKPNETQLDFTLTRPPLPKQGGYPTQKPISLLEQIISQSTNMGDKVLDLFSGSGVTLEACLNLKRIAHCIDIADEAIERMLKILDRFGRASLQIANSQSYSREQLRAFSGGSLF